MISSKKILFATILCLFIFQLLTVSAFALSNKNPLSLNRYEQKKSNWCWAACSQMSGKYFGYSHLQKDIVTKIKGDDANKGATDREFLLALQYSVDYKYQVALSGVPLYTIINQHIENNHFPVIAKIEWKNGGAHGEMITGTKQEKYVYLVDPAQGSGTEWVKYANLKKGTQIQSGNGKISLTFRFSK